MPKMKARLTCLPAALLVVAGCAPAVRVAPKASLWTTQAPPVMRASRTPWVELRALAERAGRLRFVMEPADLEIGGSRSADGMESVLGGTVDQVVPIPGMDIVSVGFLKEGAFSQADARSPAQEVQNRLGGSPGAVIIFRIFRP